MRNICYFVSSLVRVGPTNQLSYIIKHLDRVRFNPIVVTLFPETSKTLIGYFKKTLEVEVICLECNKPNALFVGKYRLRRIIQERKIDILQTQGILADHIAFNQINSTVKKIATIRNYPFDDYPSLFGKTLGRIIAAKHIATIRKNESYFIACSKAVSRTFETKEGIKLKYIQNGVDVGKFFPAKDKAEYRRKLGLPERETIFIAVGSLIPRKDYVTLIEGFKHFNGDGAYLLLIAGEGPQKEELSKIKGKGMIFLGNVPNIVDYLRAADCFISSSLSEGLPNSVMEAMACGLPCILSDIPSHKELNGKHHKHLFFKPKESEGLSEKLKQIQNQEQMKDFSIKTIG